jgi:hypothetical protein
MANYEEIEVRIQRTNTNITGRLNKSLKCPDSEKSPRDALEWFALNLERAYNVTLGVHTAISGCTNTGSWVTGHTYTLEDVRREDGAGLVVHAKATHIGTDGYAVDPSDFPDYTISSGTPFEVLRDTCAKAAEKWDMTALAAEIGSLT